MSKAKSKELLHLLCQFANDYSAVGYFSRAYSEHLKDIGGYVSFTRKKALELQEDCHKRAYKTLAEIKQLTNL